jgi:hypothetical protein
MYQRPFLERRLRYAGPQGHRLASCKVSSGDSGGMQTQIAKVAKLSVAPVLANVFAFYLIPMPALSIPPGQCLELLPLPPLHSRVSFDLSLGVHDERLACPARLPEHSSKAESDLRAAKLDLPWPRLAR